MQRRRHWSQQPIFSASLTIPPRPLRFKAYLRMLDAPATAA
jgi:hypothetical protein